MRRVLAAAAAVMCVCGIAFGDIPQVMGYQGRVTDNSGNPVPGPGPYTMRFRICTAPTGGTVVWDSGDLSVPVSDGVFSVMLGESPQPALALEFDQDYWILVSFEGENQTPRKRFGSVGYAYMASGLVPGTEVRGAVTTGDSAVIKGTNTATAGWNWGVFGEVASPWGDGVHGRATATTGNAFGGFFESACQEGGGGVAGDAPMKGLSGMATATTGTTYGVHGQSLSPDGRGVYGHAWASTGTTYGVYGESQSPDGRGVYGLATATTGYYSCGVRGESAAGHGVYGLCTATTGAAPGGRFVSYSGPGLYGISYGTTGPIGVYGYASTVASNGWGVKGQSLSTDGGGVYGYATATTGYTYGVYGESESTGGRGVYGKGTFSGVYGESESPSGSGVYGYASATYGSAEGVFSVSASTVGVAVRAVASSGSGVNYGVIASTTSPDGYGGYFGGDVHVTGNLSKASGSFLIDHPLDPENKLLRHNFVESPENLLIYRGKARLDGDGEAGVQMPEYFEALTTEDEATVNLTPIGRSVSPGRYELSYEWRADYSSFEIYGEPGRQVAWMVMAERDDPVIRQLARPVEEDKGPDNKYCDRGKLLHPTAYGYPESMGRDYERHEEERLRMEEERARMEEERARMERERTTREDERARMEGAAAQLQR